MKCVLIQNGKKIKFDERIIFHNLLNFKNNTRQTVLLNIDTKYLQKISFFSLNSAITSKDYIAENNNVKIAGHYIQNHFKQNSFFNTSEAKFFFGSFVYSKTKVVNTILILENKKPSVKIFMPESFFEFKGIELIENYFKSELIKYSEKWLTKT